MTNRKIEYWVIPPEADAEVAVRKRKTKFDWAVKMAKLPEGRYADCEKVIIVCDNLNTHTKGAFHEAFEPERARCLVRRIEFRHTPKL